MKIPKNFPTKKTSINSSLGVSLSYFGIIYICVLVKKKKIQYIFIIITFTRYIHDIRNMKPLDKVIINNISNMLNQEKMNITISLNDVLTYIIPILE
jgi:hypothetical protein